MRNSIFRRSFFVLAFAVSFISASWANGNIRPIIDVAQFKDSNNNTYLEIYYSVSESGIMYKRDDSGNYACQLVMDLDIHLDKNPWTNKIWKIERTVADTASLDANSNMVDVLRYFIEKPGSYEIVMHIKDMQQAGTIDSARIEYIVRSYSDANLEISDLQMATDISKATENEAGSSLVKNSYKITPVPAAVFGGESSNIYYYFEAYNLQNHVAGDKYKSVCKV